MRTVRLLSFVATLALITPAVARAQAGAPSPLAINSATLTIDGTSTMHDYSLKTTKLIVTAAEVAGPVLLQAGTLQAFALQIPLRDFTTEKEPLKKKFLETMKADKHPVITFKLASYTAEDALIRAKGMLTVAGVEKEIDLDLAVKETSAGVHVSGTRTLSMKEFGIKAPTMFMGMLKTNDQVTIKFALQLTHAAKASN